MRSELVSLAECAKVIVDNRGRTCPVGHSGIPLIATNCLRSGSLYPAYETERYVSEETYSHWFRGHPIPGDIIFVTKGSPGRVCMAPDPVDFCIAQDMVAIRADERIVYPKYLFALLRSSDTQRAIEDLQVGTMIPHFKKGDFDKLLLSMPEMDDQVAIGDLYFEFCARVELLHRTNATLEAIAQALFKSWFVDFDPVHAKAEGRAPAGMDAATAALFPSEFEGSELGPIPKGWRAGSLAELSDLNGSKWTARNHPDMIKYVDLSNVSCNRIEAIAEYAFADAPSRARHHLRNGDTIVGTVRPGNRAYAFVHTPDPALTGSTGFAVLSPREQTAASFIYLAATSDEGIDRLTNLADGGAYPAVRPSIVADTPVVIPPAAVIDAFGDLTYPMLAGTAENSARAAILAALRDTLLPRLISGKLRLPEARELAEVEA